MHWRRASGEPLDGAVMESIKREFSCTSSFLPWISEGMVTYSNQEKADLHFMYGFANGNDLEAERLYRQHFPKSHVTDQKMFERFHRCSMPQQRGPNNITTRQQKLLSSIQRKFLLNITGAYNTTPTAALKVIEGLMPLHIKAKMQSTLVRVGRLGRNCDYEGIHFDHESYKQPSPPSTIHPALFSLEDRKTHGGQVPSNRTPIEVYTDGSKINNQTGSAFCVIANEAITKTWKAKLSPANTVLQAEMLALKAAIEWANTANEDVNICSNSESSLQALKSFNVKSKITQEAQITFLENARIRLGWVKKAHIGIKGNEIANTLAKEATTDGIPASLPFPKSFLKKQLLQLSLSRWQAEWDNGETG
ncbi:hypothetical protein AVEN_231631-1 [Araneus ventricosus]|uniref:RNase H type-1 domain-containing protein n=1 Tax=Araneus ventricosus TaxID=182803 RepID=A0A4Y2K5M0_ARAVE|nr:hypothetical protein AVEN_231631-1 [Araneus ventricosus]